MKYEEAMEYIDTLKQYGIVPGLDSIKELCRRLGNPQEQLIFVHVAGTNGKGSTLAYISNVLKTAGYLVGRYISPAIRCYEERIQINEKNITKKGLCEELDRIKEICDEMAQEGWHHPTPFEVETALAFNYFLRMKCDVVVLETGMGGREDATNIIQNNLVSVITSVSMDHMQFLGNTLEKIAAEKAGIIKLHSHVVCLQQSDEVLAVVEKKAKEMNATFQVADFRKAKNIKYSLKGQTFDYGEYKKLKTSLIGSVQVDNAVLAIEALKVLMEKGFSIKEEHIRKGLETTVWNGRFSVISKNPLFVIDGAHNEDAAKKLAKSIEIYFTNKRIIYIMGILKDKEYEKIIATTAKYASQIITVATPGNPRAMNSLELAEEVMKVNPNVTSAASVEEAVEMSHLLAGKEDVILAFGSLSFLGRIMDTMELRKKQK